MYKISKSRDNYVISEFMIRIGASFLVGRSPTNVRVVGYQYRIFHGVKYSFFSWQTDLDENFYPMKTYRNAPNTVNVVKQTKFLLTKLAAACSSSTKFYPTKKDFLCFGMQGRPDYCIYYILIYYISIIYTR